MNAILVTPKTVEIVPARTMEFSSVSWRTIDDSFNKRLVIVVNNTAQIAVSGADYDALGQWDDSAIKAIVLKNYGLVEK